MPYLGKLNPSTKSGNEPFTHNGIPTGKSLLDYWRWAASDVVESVLRHRLAEFLVACDLGVVEGVDHQRGQSAFITPDGISVRLRSAA